jgi:hypothetical protein
VSSQYSIPELVYDCRWTSTGDHNKHFSFQYEAQGESYSEAGKYWFTLPSYDEIGKKVIYQVFCLEETACYQTHQCVCVYIVTC